MHITSPAYAVRLAQISAAMHAAQARHQRQHHASHGQIREPVHATWKGHKFVAVGNRLLVSPSNRPWKTFHDFLIDYGKRCFGQAWADAERRRSPHEQHPVYLMHQGMVRFLEATPGEAHDDGTYSAVWTGDVAAFLTLAYELFVVADNASLQKQLLRRLRAKEAYQGARHELFAAATMVRAGFKLAFEDDRDGSSKHPELIATHKKTGCAVAVEAKSRHRPGVLGRAGSQTETTKANLRRLLLEALEQNPGMPFVVFLDPNMPHAPPGPAREPAWLAEWEGTLESIQESDWKRFNLVICTNRPYHYLPTKEGPGRSVSIHTSAAARHHMPASVIADIAEAAQLYGTIPEHFPTDFREEVKGSFKEISF